MKQKQPIMWILFLLLALSILLAACSAVPTTGQDTDESDARTGRIDDASEAVHTDPSASDEQPREAAPSEGTMYARDTVTLADARFFQRELHGFSIMIMLASYSSVGSTQTVPSVTRSQSIV